MAKKKVTTMAATKTKQQTASKNAATTSSDVAATKTSQIVNVKQSQELAQVLVLASVSYLSYLRDLFPDTCFHERRYEHNASFLSYERFASGDAPQEGKRNTKIMVFKRGADSRIDKLIQWLEQGAFDALEKSFLQAIQINISERSDEPSCVLESWTFSFKYCQFPDGQKSLERLTVKSPTGKVTVPNAQWQWQSLLRDISGHCRRLGQLPDVRFLRVMLFCTKDCDPEYEAPGFRPVENDVQWYPNNEVWQRNIEDFGMMFSGYHAVTVNLSHMAPIPSFIGDASDIPANMEYPIQGFASDAADMDMDIGAGRHLLVKQAVQPVGEGTQKPQERGQATQNQSIADTRSRTSPKAGGIPGAATQDSTQSEGVQMAQALREMAHQTKESLGAKGGTQPLKSQPGVAIAVGDWFQGHSVLRLTERTLAELESGNAAAQQESESGGIIECPCGVTEADEAMFSCYFCHHWQHVSCYGYTHADDPRIPKNTPCYKCLLAEKEPNLLQKLEHLTILRKGAALALKQGIDTDRSFTNSLHCPLDVASKVATTLKNRGYVTATPGSRARGFRSKGLPLFRAVPRESPKFKAMMEEYFEPTLHIAHHFKSPQRNFSESRMETHLPAPPEAGPTHRTNLVSRLRSPITQPVVPENTTPTTPLPPTTPPQSRKRGLPQDDEQDEGRGSRKRKVRLSQTEAIEVSQPSDDNDLYGYAE